VERVREGWEVFDPSAGANSFVPTVFDEDILLIAQFSRPNSEKAIVVATQTAIYGLDYRPGSEATEYVTPGFWAEGYVAKNAFVWEKLADGFSTDGNRWEAVSINGSLFLNNGVDLPHEYRIEWDTARPLYELREVGIASVGTIAEYRGYLMVADITDLKADDLPRLMNSEDPYGRVDPAEYVLERVVYDLAWSQPMDGSRWMPILQGKIRVHGGKVLAATRTSNVASFQTQGVHGLEVGDLVSTSGIGSDFDVTLAAVTEVSSLFSFSVANVGADAAINPDEASWEPQPKSNAVNSYGRSDGVVTVFLDTEPEFIPGEIVALTGLTDPTMNVSGAVVLNVSPSSQTFSFAFPGADIPLTVNTGTVTLVRRSDLFLADYPVMSFEVGQSVSIIGAGAGGGTLTTKIKAFSGKNVILEKDAITHSDNGLIASDAIGAVVGRTSLQAESNRIIKMASLSDRFVVFHTGGCFVGSASDGEVPFVFDNWYRGPNVPTFRHTLTNVLDKFLVFLGRDGYYRMDFSERSPVWMDLLNNASVSASEEPDSEIEHIFAFLNKATHEVWFVFSGHTEAYSFKYEDVSIIDSAFTAGAMVEKLVADKFSDTEAYPILAKDRILIQSGFGFLRLGRPYVATLESGHMDFGDGWREKTLLAYTLLASSRSQSDSVTVSLFSASTPSETPVLLETQTLTDLRNRNMIPTHYLDTYFRDRIVVDVNGRDFALSKRIFELGWITSRHNTMRQHD
jgi:hypothetical protein